MRKLWMICLAVPLLMGSCKEEVVSQMSAAPPAIDGDLSDWGGDLIIYQEEGVVCGLSHDESHLYLALSSRKPETLRAIMRSGLTVWLNDQGRSKKSFGIQYPLPMNREEFRALRRTGSGGRSHQNGGNRDWQNPENRNRMMAKLFGEYLSTQTDFSLLSGPGHVESQQALSVSESIKAAVTFRDGQFSYELSIPFDDAEDGTMALHKNPKSRYNIGIEIPAPDLTRMRGGRPMGDGMSGGMSGGGMSGGSFDGGGQFSGSGMRQGGDRSRYPQQTDVELWLKVRCTP